MSLAKKRAESFGKVGDYLLSLLNKHSANLPELDPERDFISRLVTLTNCTNALRSSDPLLPAAASLLLLDFPLQYDLDFGDMLRLIRGSYSLPGSSLAVSACDVEYPAGFDTSLLDRPGRFVRRLCRSRELREKWFPEKSLIAGQTKTNTLLAPLLKSAVVLLGSHRVAHLCTLGLGTHADHFQGVIIYTYIMYRRHGEAGYLLGSFLGLNPTAAKHVTMVVKALGLNSTEWGARLCEVNTLAGRGVGEIDLLAAARERSDPDKVAAGCVRLDADELRPHLRALLKSELREGTGLQDLHEFWSSRWLWCVNGSQTSESSRGLGIDPSFLSKTHSRVYRRAASEAVRDEPISTWDGSVSVSASNKLEAGKTRAIFACDTRSYFAFSWILSAVQKGWRNSRIILDPGVGGHLGIHRRIRHAQRGGGVNLMLDYDDFNSQHSTEVMKALFDELCQLVHAPAWYRDLLVGSFDKMTIKVGGQAFPVAGTLMSGHRGTTFINSVLNAAYIRAAVGGHYFDRLLSLHTGDDVYIRANTLSDCGRILADTARVGCRMNPSKQSVGLKGAEFLRMGIRGNASYGYVARAISSFVAGNWANPDPLEALDSLQTAISSCRTLINRGGELSVADLVAPALRYSPRLGIRTVVRLMRGEVAIAGSPIFGGGSRLTTYSPSVPAAEAIDIPGDWKRFATKDYLANHVSTIESEAMHLAAADTTSLLITSSYSKGLDKSKLGLSRQVTWKKDSPQRALGYANAADLLQTRPDKGVLTKYPLINLVRQRLTRENVETLLVHELGYLPPGDALVNAFGGDYGSKRILGVLSFSDAAALCKRTTSGTIFTLNRISV